MHHEISLISTIAAGLVYALIGGYFAARLRLPPLVGYLLAGVALGPFTPGVVADAHLAPQLAEIGVILLMFGVGMHFSIRDLLAVRHVAVPGALLQIASAVALTCAVGRWWGWSLGSSLVLGLALSVASTVVLLRALEAQGILKSVSGQIAIGWLIVEDLFTVIILVLLPVFATALGGQPIDGTVRVLHPADLVDREIDRGPRFIGRLGGAPVGGDCVEARPPRVRQVGNV